MQTITNVVKLSKIGMQLVIQSVQKLTNAFSGFVTTAEAVADVGDSFRFFTKQAGLAEIKVTDLQKAVAGSVSQLDVMRAVNVALAQGLRPTQEQMETLAKVAFVAAQREGRPVNQMLVALTKSLGSLQTIGLKNAGIIIDQTKLWREQAATLGITTAELTIANKQQSLLTATVAQFNSIQPLFQKLVKGSVGETEQIGPALEDFNAEVGKIITQSPLFQDFIQGIIDGYKSAGVFIADNREEIQKWITVFIEGIQDIGPLFREVFEIIISLMPLIVGAFRLLAAIIKPIIEAIKPLLDIIKGIAVGIGTVLGAIGRGISLQPVGALGRVSTPLVLRSTPPIQINVNVAAADIIPGIEIGLRRASRQIMGQIGNINFELKAQADKLANEILFGLS